MCDIISNNQNKIKIHIVEKNTELTVCLLSRFFQKNLINSTILIFSGSEVENGFLNSWICGNIIMVAVLTKLYRKD